MNFLENISNAFGAIISNKLRSGLTMLGIIIGVSSVIVMIAIGEGAQKSVTSRISQLGTNLLLISPGAQSQSNVRNTTGSVTTLENEDSSALDDIEGIAAISPEISGRKQVIYGSNNTSTTVTGVLPDYETVRNFPIESGQFITEEQNTNFDRVIVLGVDVVSELFENENPIGKTVRIENGIFTVIGVMSEKGGSGFSNADNVVFVPLSTAQIRIFGKKSLASIAVSVAEVSEMDTVKTKIESALRISRDIPDGTESDFTVLNQADAIETLSEVTQIFTLLLGGIAGISLLVGGIGVMNIMLVSVTERTREIGIRKAIGAKRRDILAQFLTESVFLSLSGGAIGVAISFGITTLVRSKVSIDAVISVNSILLAVIFSVSVGVFFGIFPAHKAGKLKPIDALRFE